MASISAGTIKLFVLGDARIETPRGEIEPNAQLVFAAGLYLILERRKPVARRELENLLWPQVAPAVASHRMRQTLLKLKRNGLPIVSVGKGRLRLNASALFIDYEELISEPPRELGSARDRLTPFQGYAPSFSAPFSEWLDEQRKDVSRDLTRLMLAAVARHRILGRWAEVEASAKTLLRLSAYNEEAVLALAEAQAMRGEKVEAVRILDTYLAEIGRGPSDLRVSATMMRRRIAERLPPRPLGAGVDAPLIGREESMARLGSQLPSLKVGSGGSCMIYGEAGIGKSRLLTEFLTFAALQGITSQRVQCRAGDANRPFSVFLDLVPMLMRMRGAIGSSPETLAYLDRITKLCPAARDEEIPESIDQPVRHFEYAFGDLVDAISEEAPVIIAIEDTHWLDSTSSGLLLNFMTRSPKQRVLYVLTGRATFAPLDTGDSGTTVLGLTPLNSSASTDLVLSLLRQHARDITRDYLEWCVNVAEGNPYFLQELATQWIETGEEHIAPSSLSAVLRQRVSRLTPPALQLLQTAALLENHSTLSNIERVLGYPSHEMLRSINELGTANMLTVNSADLKGGSPNRLISRHDLLSDTAVMLLTPPGTAFLHRRIGQVLEEQLIEGTDASMLWSSAKHWGLAGDVPRALHLATSCADHLLQVGLPSEAAEAFERALDYCATNGSVLAILERQATAFYRGSAWQRVLEVSGRARAIKQQLQPLASVHDDLELMTLRAEWQTLQWPETVRKALVCVETETATPSHRVEAATMALMLLAVHGDEATGERVFRTIEAISCDPDVSPTTILQATMVFHANWGSVPRAVAAARSIMEENANHRNIGDTFRCYCNAAVAFRIAGLGGEARQSLGRALQLVEGHHLHMAKGRLAINYANLALECGHLEEARMWLCRLRESPRGSDDQFAELEERAIATRIALSDVEPLKARLVHGKDLALVNADPVHHRRTYHAALLVAIELGLYGRPSGDALGALEKAHMLSRANAHQSFAAATLFIGLESLGEIDSAHQILDEYLSFHRREPWPIPQHMFDGLRELMLAPNHPTP